MDPKVLISITPFPEDVKKELADKYDSFSPEKQFEIAQTCWELLSLQYNNELKFRLDKATWEMAKREKTYTKEDMQKIEDDFFKEFVSRFDTSENEEKIDEIRQKLATTK